MTTAFANDEVETWDRAATNISIKDPTVHVKQVLGAEGRLLRGGTEITQVSHSLASLTKDFLGLSLVGTEWSPPMPSQGQVLGRADSLLRDVLGLAPAQIARLAGRSLRRYQEWSDGDPMPPRTLAEFADAVSIAADLYRLDPWTTKVLFGSDEDALDRLRTRDESGLWQKFTALRHRLAAVSERPEERLLALFDDPGLLSAMADPSALENTLRALEIVLPATHAASEIWRVRVIADLAGAIVQLRSSNSLPGHWAFLAALDDDEIDTFRSEAATTIARPQTRPDDWARWLASIEENAFRSIEPFELAPLAPDAPQAPTEPDATATLADLHRFGISLSRPKLPER